MNDTHPDPAEIAALDAELLPPDEAAALRDHLADCAHCAAVLADLHALSAELNAIPSPPIPADVAARLDATLMAEAAAATVSRETSTVRPRRWPRMALAAAAALVALGLGGTLIQTADLGASPESAGGGDAATDESLQGELGAAESADDPLAGEVRRLLAGDGATTLDSQSDEEPTEQETERDLTTVPLPPCVWNAIGRTEEPLAASEERFGGRDAYVVVLAHPRDSDQVDAYAVAADCATRTPATAGEILAQGDYPREP
ncbi:anti-sigma factor family protein [Streptomyces sp. 6N223]|uniref:anti-sigma factor family protein n=1 Tax=Streptomyces sp. 6N223 TaxID=3457412 RepID=UPI003FCF894A